jgi:enoyl-CoA hydratase
LVTRIVDGDARAAGVAFSGAFKYSLPVLKFANDAVRRASDLPIYEGLKVEADLATLAYRTDDAEEGMAAFVEKRPPKFRDA